MNELFRNPWVNLFLFLVFIFVGANLFHRELKSIKTKEDILSQIMKFFTSSSMLWPGLLLVIVSIFFLGNFFRLI
jgi:hypothetical protein